MDTELQERKKSWDKSFGAQTAPTNQDSSGIGRVTEAYKSASTLDQGLLAQLTELRESNLKASLEITEALLFLKEHPEAEKFINVVRKYRKY